MGKWGFNEGEGILQFAQLAMENAEKNHCFLTPSPALVWCVCVLCVNLAAKHLVFGLPVAK